MKSRTGISKGCFPEPPTSASSAQLSLNQSMMLYTLQQSALYTNHINYFEVQRRHPCAENSSVYRIIRAAYADAATASRLNNCLFDGGYNS
jgi:hypothetical protein